MQRLLKRTGRGDGREVLIQRFVQPQQVALAFLKATQRLGLFADALGHLHQRQPLSVAGFLWKIALGTGAGL